LKGLAYEAMSRAYGEDKYLWSTGADQADIIVSAEAW
jgi:hypothetical protein